jgi:murein L,D-transpeptidase YafK
MKYLSILLILFLAACTTMQLPPQIRAIFKQMEPELEQAHVKIGDPVFIRVFKEENILELWMRPKGEYRYRLVKTYPICKWSGALGPKFFEGDHQAPEGFYATDLQKLNPNSMYHLSFNIGFPNAYDRFHGRTGSFIMIHGDCVSEGCYAMTDPKIEEIYYIVQQALLNGQAEVPIHTFPFKMSPTRLHLEFKSPHYPFWVNLKEGYDYFEQYGVPPLWGINSMGQYDFY